MKNKLTFSQLKKELTEKLKERGLSLKQEIRIAEDNTYISEELSNVIDSITNINIETISSDLDSWLQVSYYEKKLGKTIILNYNFSFTDVNSFIHSLMEEIGEMEKIKNHII